MTNHRPAPIAKHAAEDSILITPEQQAAQAADQARRDAERIRRAHEFRESLTNDFDRELFLDKSTRDNPYARALIGAANSPEPEAETEPARGSGNGYAGRDRMPSYGSVGQTLAKATAAIDRMNPED